MNVRRYMVEKDLLITFTDPLWTLFLMWGLILDNYCLTDGECEDYLSGGVCRHYQCVCPTGFQQDGNTCAPGKIKTFGQKIILYFFHNWKPALCIVQNRIFFSVLVS